MKETIRIAKAIGIVSAGMAIWIVIPFFVVIALPIVFTLLVYAALKTYEKWRESQ